MKRYYIIVLILIMGLLSGCWFSVGSQSKSLQLTIELEGVLGENQEIMFTNSQGQTFLVELHSGKAEGLDLGSGSWELIALSRSKEGSVTGHTPKPIIVRGGGERIVRLDLVRTTHQSTEVRPHNLTHSLVAKGGLDLSWESADTGEGTWELWSRPLDGKLWGKVTQVTSEERKLTYSELNHTHIYAIRFVPLKSTETIWASPLVRLPFGTLELTWHFEHYFPFVSQRFASLSRVEQFSTEPTYADLVAHFWTPTAFEQRLEILAKLGLENKGEIPSLLAVLVEPSPNSLRSLEEWATYEDSELFLEPNWIVGAHSLAAQQANYPWYLKYVRIPEAHNITTGSHDVRIAILDTGLNSSRLGSGVNELQGYNFIDKDKPFDTTDDHQTIDAQFHGTTIAQSIELVMPDVSIQPVKVLDNKGNGNVFQLAEGLLYAAGKHDTVHNPTPAQIINMSLGAEHINAGEISQLLAGVKRVLQGGDALLVAASGNWSSSSVAYPAAFPEVLAVGAISPSQWGPERAYYSNYGEGLDLVAPPTFQEGTSFATAIVSGVAGLMLSNKVSLGEIREILTRTAMDLGTPGYDVEYGYGLVNAHWAVLGIATVSLELLAEGHSVFKQKIPLRRSSQELLLPPGEYTLQMWVNLANKNSPRPGDYWAEVQFTILEGEVQQNHATLSELPW